VPEVPKALAYLLQSIANGLPNMAMTMLIAVAYALIFGLVGRINLAFGDFAAFGGIVSIAAALTMLALGSNSLAVNLVLAAAFGVGLTVLAGQVVEHLVFAPLAFRSGQSILIATVGVAAMMRELMRLLEGPQNRWVPPIDAMPIPLVKAESFVVNVTPMQIGVGFGATLLALLVARLMHVSEFGRRWRAISDDALMANLMGISSRGMLSQTFALASALAGLSGFIMTATYGGTDAYGGVLIGLKGLVAAVIGGIGSVEGALLGGLALGLFEMIWQAYLPIGDRDVAVMVVMVVMLIFRPGGLLGYAESGPRQV
jgi:branched-subunit amino acid ABC-type transport system permease component